MLTETRWPGAWLGRQVHEPHFKGSIHMAKTKTTTKKTSSKKTTEQARKEAIASIDENLADGEAKPKASPRGGKKTDRKPAKPKASRNGKLSGLDAAAQILAKAKEPMGCKDLVEQAIEAKLWSPGGKTPHATLYAAIIREIANKGKDARFQKVARGRFQLRKGA